ncbi:hypothetical protein KR546_18760, partial [Nitriliruptoria bacterium AS10]
MQYLAGDLAGAVEAAVDGSASVAGRGTSGSTASLLAFAAPFVAQPGEDVLAVHARTEHALDMARAVGDQAVLCDVLACHGLALARVGRVGEARATLAEAQRLANGATDPRRVLRPAVFELAMLHAAGASAEVAALGRRTLDRARELGVELAVGQQVRTLVADALVSLGEWDEAAEVVEDGLAWGDEPLAGALLLVARIELALRRGRLVEAARDLETARGLMPAGHYRLERVEAELAWLRRDRTASRAHAARALAMGGVVASDDEIGSLADALVRATSVEDLERDDGIPH